MTPQAADAQARDHARMIWFGLAVLRLVPREANASASPRNNGAARCRDSPSRRRGRHATMPTVRGRAVLRRLPVGPPQQFASALSPTTALTSARCPRGGGRSDDCERSITRSVPCQASAPNGPSMRVRVNRSCDHTHPETVRLLDRGELPRTVRKTGPVTILARATPCGISGQYFRASARQRHSRNDGIGTEHDACARRHEREECGRRAKLGCRRHGREEHRTSNLP